MPVRKTYEPHCPAQHCNGGTLNRIYRVDDPASVEMPADALATRPPMHLIWRCLYCGLVWFQSTASQPGFEPTIVGYHNTFNEAGWRTLENARPRPENTRAYWQEYADALEHRRELARKRRGRLGRRR